MSEVRVNNIVDYGGKGAPTFDNGAVISGVSSLGSQAKIGSNVTITSGGINVSGVTTAATLSGNLTGDVNSGFVTATSAVIGSGVTINAGGLNITGVVTATTFEGDGSSMTGVAMTIAPLSYNPDVNDSIVSAGTGIGITFDHRLLAGSGNVTLSVATNAGAAGTTVENFGVGSSVTIAGRKVTIDPASDLNEGETYHISYPSGAFTNTSGDVSYVGTAYTFGVVAYERTLFTWGHNEIGSLGQNTAHDADRSSPVQVPGLTWKNVCMTGIGAIAVKSDNTMWVWGDNEHGALGLNQHPGDINYSSPVQLPGTNWSSSHRAIAGSWYNAGSISGAIKTDGTLWTWGDGSYGALGQNAKTDLSSPTQIPGTTWSKLSMSGVHGGAIKTDGTLWVWGKNHRGCLGQNQGGNNTGYSSPVQIPGTTWSDVCLSSSANYCVMHATKTDGTLWSWGYNERGQSAQNNRTNHSSPVQVPGTTWSSLPRNNGWYRSSGSQFAIKTDGTLWAWGNNNDGNIGIPAAPAGTRSSPVQIPGTTWSKVTSFQYSACAVKTDGTLWAWGHGGYGALGQNNETKRSSPIQIGSETNWTFASGGNYSVAAIRKT